MTKAYYRTIMAGPGKDAGDPIAVAFDAILRILHELPGDMTLPVLANVLASALSQLNNLQRAEHVLQQYCDMVRDCMAANVPKADGETLQ